jgi:hypothetical protein
VTSSGDPRDAWRHLREAGPADRAESARRLLVDRSSAGAAAAEVVAAAALQYCVAYEVDLRD